MVVYGGDEVSALVFDIGSHTIRAGYAGEDTPKCVIPTAFGYTDLPPPAGAAPDAPQQRTRKFFVGEDGVNVWRPGMEVGNVTSDGIVHDASALPSILNHVLHSRLKVNPHEHPLLTTEPAWNTAENRENMADLAFEQEGVPAWYTACSGVLSAFAAGKGTALVVDVGADLVSVTPVYEGYVLRSGTRREPMGMTLLQAQAKAILQTVGNGGRTFPLSLTPHHLIKSRTPVPTGQAPKFTLRDDRIAGTTESWRHWAENKVVENWREACVAAFETPFDERYAVARPPRAYEFPDGYNQAFSLERYHVGESMFDTRYINAKAPVPTSLRATPTHVTQDPDINLYSYSVDQVISIAKLAAESVMACDLDVRAGLLSNIVVVGGGSLTHGLVDRLNWEIGQLAPGQKVRIHAPGHPIERRFSSWLGGSILASLGTFHQLWISKAEYQEHGPNIIAQRCK